MAEKKGTNVTAKDSGTESAGAAVNEAATPAETRAETPSEEAAVAEQAEATAAEPAAPAEPEAPAEPPAQSQPKKKYKRLPRALRHKHSKPVREHPASRKSISRTPRTESAPARRQERRDVVVSDKGDKTIIVSVDVTKLHPRYKKVVRRTRKFHAHDEQNAAAIGDVVRIVETRPLSKTKNWRLAEIVEKAR